MYTSLKLISISPSRVVNLLSITAFVYTSLKLLSICLIKSLCIRKVSLVIFIVEPSTLTLITSPFLTNPSPATICPAPLNCEKSNFVLPTVTTSGEFVPFVKIKPLSLLIFPNSTNVNAP